MPKEALDPVEASEYLKGGDLINHGPFIDSTSRHPHYLYGIKPTTEIRNQRLCEYCNEPTLAAFLRWEKDHMGKTWISLSCGEHSPESFFDMRDRRQAPSFAL